MRYLIMLFTVIAVVLIVCLGVRFGMAAPDDTGPAAAAAKTGFAVVELFTSEGCSSCPPADKYLGELVADARKTGRRVYPLAFHVDYWDRLGWRDRFGDPAYSQRQGDYAAAFKLEGVYTPQMVVNGVKEFVGSDRVTARRAIDAALSREAEATVELSFTPGKTDAATYRVSGTLPDDAVLNVALVERGLRTPVRDGENAGRELAHENVVRWFRAIDVKSAAAGELKIEVPAGVVRANASVVAYVQAPGPRRVLGATAIDLR